MEWNASSAINHSDDPMKWNEATLNHSDDSKKRTAAAMMTHLHKRDGSLLLEVVLCCEKGVDGVDVHPRRLIQRHASHWKTPSPHLHSQRPRAHCAGSELAEGELVKVSYNGEV